MYVSYSPLQQIQADSKQSQSPVQTSNLNREGAASAANAVKNHPVTQDLANGTHKPTLHEIWHSLLSGPVATSVKNEADATTSEFGNLAGSRAAPSQTAANDTPLTRKIESQ